MLLRLLRSFAGGPAAAVELVPPVDLPGEADPAIVRALREAHVALARDATRAAAVLARTSGRHPHDALAYALHGAFLERAGDEEAAQRAFAAAQEADAGRDLHARVGYHFFARGIQYLNEFDHGSAERCLQLARRLMPKSAAPLEMLAFKGYLSGDVSAARAWYDRALEVATDAERGALEINRLIDTLPQVGDSSEELAVARTWFEAELDRLLAHPPIVHDPIHAVHRAPFFLGYQGLSDRATNARLAELFLRACPGLGYQSPGAAERAPRAGGKLTVGFVSGHLGRHSVGVWYRELVRTLIESDRFETVLFAYGEIVDTRLKETAESREAFVSLGDTLEEARAAIEARAPDVLIFVDLFLHTFLYFLGFSRLAPVQALLIGHPCTSGVPEIDYFVSNVFQESEQGQEHYSEQLVRLPKIVVHVPPSAPPAEPLSRAELGWLEDTRYYVCPMLLQKMHPDFDDALAGILRRDPQGQVVLFADKTHPLWQLQLEERFVRIMPDVAGRIGFRPFAPTTEFLSILLAADCVLDTFHFSGGVTSYVVISLGLPLITLPGELFRSRMTAGMYWQAGVTDCIARSPEDYVELAVAFAADPVARAAYRARILAARPKLFETSDAVDVLGDWIASAASTPA
jgi:predicted O-linked N-acetylglucosamine transferase (SPINDLY family)